MSIISRENSDRPAYGTLAGLESVECLAVIQKGRIKASLHNHSDKAHDSPAMSQTYLVTDLISNVSYVVSQFGSRTQLLIPVEDRLIVAEVDSSADFSQIAETLTSGLSA